MKVNVSQIFVDHLSTLRNASTGKMSLSDVVTFFVVPVAIGCGVYFADFQGSKDFYNVSISFYGVFVALLLNFQVAAFGIYNRKWRDEEDEKLLLLQNKEFELRRSLLREINANISYLILFSAISILVFILLYTADWIQPAAAAVSCALYIHFVLTLLMVVKRSDVLFRREYDEA